MTNLNADVAFIVVHWLYSWHCLLTWVLCPGKSCCGLIMAKWRSHADCTAGSCVCALRVWNRTSLLLLAVLCLVSLCRLSGVRFLPPSVNLPSPTGKREAGWSREEKRGGGISGTWGGRGYSHNSTLAPKFPKSRKSSLGFCSLLICYFFSTSQDFKVCECVWGEISEAVIKALWPLSPLTKLAGVDPTRNNQWWPHWSAFYPATTSCFTIRKPLIVAG